MDRVFRIAERPIDASRFVALVIGEPEPNQRHIGIVHRPLNESSRVLHLAWYCQLQNDETMPPYFTVWVEFGWDVLRLRQLAAFCRRVWKKNQAHAIPYAFSPPQGALDPISAEFLMGPTHLGLTCSSFVLAVCASAGIHLVDPNTWISGRPGDDAWQNAILEKLASRADETHIEHVRAEIGSVRFRPEEVAAGAALSPPPATMDEAEALGLQIVSRLRAFSEND